jgi:hypothetical protein
MKKVRLLSLLFAAAMFFGCGPSDRRKTHSLDEALIDAAKSGNAALVCELLKNGAR